MSRRPTTSTPRRVRALPTPAVFARHLVKGAAVSGSMVGIGLAIGAIGYHVTEGIGWLDATVNAAMLLAGEGPLAAPHSVSGKLFAIAYAIFGGIVFITAASVLLAPVAHRFLHRFHLEIADDDGETA